MLLGTTPDRVDAQLAGAGSIPVAPAQVATGMPRICSPPPRCARGRIHRGRAISGDRGRQVGTFYLSFSLGGSFGYVGHIAARRLMGACSTGTTERWRQRLFVFPIFNYGRIVNSVRCRTRSSAGGAQLPEHRVRHAQEVEDARSAFAAAQSTLDILTEADASARRSDRAGHRATRKGRPITPPYSPPSSCSCRSRMRSPPAAAQCRWHLCRLPGTRRRLAVAYRSEPPARGQPAANGEAYGWGHMPDEGARLPAVEDAPKGDLVKPTSPRHAGQSRPPPPRALLAVSAAVLLAACGKKQPNHPPPPPTVTVSKPLSFPVTDYLQSTGSVAASKTVDLVARVKGYCAVRISRTAVSSRQATAVCHRAGALRGELASRQAQLLNAQSEYERQLRMIKEDATSQANVEKWQSQRDQAAAAVHARQDEPRVHTHPAPFTGRIGRPGRSRRSGRQRWQRHQLATLEQIEPAYATSASTNATSCACVQPRGARGTPIKAEAPAVPVMLGLQPRPVIRTGRPGFRRVPASIPAAVPASCVP